MKPTIYITGNDALPEDQYREQLEQTEKQVRKAVPHAAIINPLKLGIPASWSDDERLRLRIRTLKSCNAAVFAKGWIKGEIAKQEYWHANTASLDVFLENQTTMLQMEYGEKVIS